MLVHTLRLPEPLEKELFELVKSTGKTKTYFMIEAIKQYLEDRSDYIKASSILEKIETGEMKTTPLEEIIKKYGLES